MGKVFYGPKNKGDYIEDAMRLWECYSSSYRKFKKMIDGQKRGEKQPFRIPNAVIVEFPTIDLLQKQTEAEARDYLELLSESSIRLITRIVKRIEYNYGYRFMREQGISYRLLDIRHPSCPFRGLLKKQFGVDPDGVMSGNARKKSYYDTDSTD